LRHSQGEDLDATAWTLHFDLRYTGKGVSAQTAHKWLSGHTPVAVTQFHATGTGAASASGD
jgi:hypothetical protein